MTQASGNRLFDMIQRQPEAPILPHNDEAEQSLIGALMLRNDLYDKLPDGFGPEHFYAPVHGRIYDEIADRIRCGKVANPITLKVHFEDDHALKELGGSRYLADLVASVLSTSAAPDYANAIMDLARRRQAISAAERIRMAAFDMGVKADDLPDQIEAEASALYGEGNVVSTIVTMREAADQAVRTSERAFQGLPRNVIKSGIDHLDASCFLEPGTLTLLAARPSMGKTALAVSLAINAARSGCPVHFVSSEMTPQAIAHRALARFTSLSTGQQKSELISMHQFQHLMTAKAEHLDALPIEIDGAGSQTVGKIRRSLRHWRRKLPEITQAEWSPGLVIIDHLGRIRSDNPRHETYDIISENVMALKNVAKDLNIPVVLLVQLNRQVEQREDKHPMLSDLRDSGRIEEEADNIVFLFREHYYLERSEPVKRPNEAADKFSFRLTEWEQRKHETRDQADLFVAKNREGETRTVKVRWDGVRQTFENAGGV